MDSTPASLRNGLLSQLRPLDEAIILPQAEQCAETQHFKNIVYRLAGDESGVPIGIFSPSWFSGVSVVKVSEEDAEPILSNKEKRKAAMEALKEAIPSEMADSSIQVGPALDGDMHDRDASEWVAGFDGPGCCVGLYCAEHSHPPDAGKMGMNRMHREFYLVCKAGSGLAGSTFHTRLVAALKKGRTLDECLERGSEPGPQALRRVSNSGSRNRARILLAASKALGLMRVDTLGDQGSGSRYRGAVCAVDVSINCIRKIETEARSTYQYSTCVDSTACSGLVSCSNVSDGFVLFLTENGDIKRQLRNDAYSSVPFASPRLRTTKEMLSHVLEEWADSLKRKQPAHPDDEFIRAHFCWKSRVFAEKQVDIEPLPLWGSHTTESYSTRFYRELGLAPCQVVRLRPKLVCLAAIEPGKLRPAVRHLQQAATS